MKQLLRRFSRVADCSPRHRAAARVPEGHVPLHVGEGDEVERFVVRAELLARPPLVELLRRSAQEYGYEQRGVLRIPCPVPAFEKLLEALGTDALALNPDAKLAFS